jgi:two-component system sensor histidine kinase DesK
VIAVLDRWRGDLRCAWHRNASAFVWTLPLLLAPILDLHGGAGERAFQLTLIVVIAVSAVVAAVAGARSERDLWGYAALAVMTVASIAGATLQSSQWLPTWILLANVVPAVLRGRRLLVVVPIVAAASMWAAAVVEPHHASRVWAEGFVVLLAGAASSAFAALIDAVTELRRTRVELARMAVADERERFARDLHDLLGHTLSVMVVKAQAVRRLAATDPDAATEHAADIEQIGRRALGDVRQAVDAMRAPTLAGELDEVRRALDAAGIATSVDWSATEPSGKADEVLAWVLREGATNVMRHSGASVCRIELVERDGRHELTIADDGVGAPSAPQVRLGGLAGLRDRLAAAGGELAVERPGEGFRLVATVPGGGR